MLPPVQPAARGAEGRACAEVQVLGPWSGPDLESFWALARPFAQRNNLALSFESTPDVAGILASRIREGATPHIAILPSVALARRYARAGLLVPLRQALDVDQLCVQYPPGWLDLTSVDGEPYGLLYRASNRSLVWYSPAEFQRHRWSPPQTWGELVSLSEQIAERGLAPWSLGLKSHVADGEAGTDWVENILLRTAGPEVYDRWLRHEIPWTDPAVRQAFQRWGQIVGRPRHLSGGSERAQSTSPQEALASLYQERPAAYLCLAGSAALPLIAQRFPPQAGGRDYDFFPLPPLDRSGPAPVVAGADVIVLLRHTPEAAVLLTHLASLEVQGAWAERGGYVALGPEPARYPDPLSQRAARQLLEAPVLRFDASAQMPPEVERAFCRAVCSYLANPNRLDAILQEVEDVAQVAYPLGGSPPL
jgi:alpha-glucoside transport system substrate-binding protein